MDRKTSRMLTVLEIIAIVTLLGFFIFVTLSMEKEKHDLQTNLSNCLEGK